MIRCENSSLEEEISAIGSMVRRAFASVPDHHGNEQDGVAEEQLISRLRKNENVFFPQLSLVYVENDEIIGKTLSWTSLSETDDSLSRPCFVNKNRNQERIRKRQ